MNRETATMRFRFLWPLILCVAWPGIAWTQTAPAEIEEIEEFTVFSSSEIEELIGPIALYPDDLLAIVLPASTYPLQIVEAARFLEALEEDSSLQPDADWDDSIVALLNYPEVIELLNEDLDWTWRLGEAVVAQQSDVIAAIELFRDRAYAAGNLESDDYQIVAHEGSSIQITPVEEDVIYVPYYEPEEVVVYQPRRVYYYYPRAYPVYYYPYPSHHTFYRRHFWGVTTAFSIGWNLHCLNVFHHSFYGHPYYGYTYRDRWWYRRPDINFYNNYYVRNYGVNYNRYRDGDRWYPNVRSTIRQSDQRVTRTRYYAGSESTARNNRSRSGNTSFAPSLDRDRTVRSRRSQDRNADRPAITFRERPNTPSIDRSGSTRPSLDREFTRTERTTRTSRTTQPNSTRSTNARADSTRSTNTRPSTRPRVSTSRPSTGSRSSQVRPTSEREPQINFRRESTPTLTTRSRSSTSRSSTSRASNSRSQPTRTSQPKVSTSRSSQPRTHSSRSSKPRTQSSRSSQSRTQSSRSSQSRAQASRSSQSKAPSSKSSRQSQSRSGSRESQRRR